MGYSAESALFYGFTQPYDDFESWDQAKDEAEDVYGWREMEEKIGITFGLFGSSDERQYYIAITETHSRGDWGEPTIIDPEKIITKSEWEPKLRTFAERFGMHLNELQPQWYITSYYG